MKKEDGKQVICIWMINVLSWNFNNDLLQQGYYFFDDTQVPTFITLEYHKNDKDDWLYFQGKSTESIQLPFIACPNATLMWSCRPVPTKQRSILNNILLPKVKIDSAVFLVMVKALEN